MSYTSKNISTHCFNICFTLESWMNMHVAFHWLHVMWISGALQLYTLPLVPPCHVYTFKNKSSPTCKCTYVSLGYICKYMYMKMKFLSNPQGKCQRGETRTSAIMPLLVKGSHCSDIEAEGKAQNVWLRQCDWVCWFWYNLKCYVLRLHKYIKQLYFT